MRHLLCLTLVTLLACSNSSTSDGPTFGCLKTTDCGTGLVCNMGACIAPGGVSLGGACTASRDCSGGYCSPAGRCATSGTKGNNAACVSDADCAAGLRCDLYGFGGSCVPGGQVEPGDGCTSNLQCLNGLYCVSAVCTSFAQAFVPFRGVQCKPDSSAFHSYFVVPRSTNQSDFDDLFRLPYPNDLRVSGKNLDLTGFPHPGITVLGVDIVNLYAQALATDFDGFSGIAPIIFRFSEDIEFTGDNTDPKYAFSIQGEARPHFFDLKTGEENGNLNLGYEFDASKFNCGHMLLVTQSPVPVAPGHQYLVFIPTTLHSSAGGVAATQDPDLAALLGDTAPADASLAAAYATYKPARDFFKSKNIAPSKVAAVALYTVADVPAHMKALAAAVAKEPAPELSGLFQCGVSTGTDPCDDGTDARKCGSDASFIEIHGKMKTPIYQTGTVPYLKPSDGGALKESGGVVSKDHDDQVCFGLTIPKSAGPWPLVVYSHGTGGSFRSFITDGVAAKAAAAGAAAFSFDSVGHGARRGTSTKSPDALVFNVLNPQAARDNWLQGAADILTAFKLGSTSPAPSGWTGPALKFGKVAFFGHSQGSTSGELALAFSNTAGAAVLSGAGADLTISLIEKKSPTDVPGTIGFLLGESFSGDHPMGFIWQNYFDRSDPANYNNLIIQAPPAGLNPKNVMMTWGVGDTYAPKDTLASNAETLGVQAVNPILEVLGNGIARPVSKNVNGVFGAVFQYTPSGYDGHFVAQMNADAQRDWNAFLTSFFSTGTPTVP